LAADGKVNEEGMPPLLQVALIAIILHRVPAGRTTVCCSESPFFPAGTHCLSEEGIAPLIPNTWTDLKIKKPMLQEHGLLKKFDVAS
jgi:hypothetical protein